MPSIILARVTLLIIKLQYVETVKIKFYFDYRLAKANVLFDFIQIEHGRGLMLSTKDVREGPYSVVLHNFRQSANITHLILHKAANARVS